MDNLFSNSEGIFKHMGDGLPWLNLLDFFCSLMSQKSTTYTLYVLKSDLSDDYIFSGWYYSHLNIEFHKLSAVSPGYNPT